MRYVDIKELCQEDLNVREVEIFPEMWTRRKRFDQYQTLPRPTSALFLICTEITVTFFPRGEAPIVGKMGDVIYIPKGICYHVHTSDTQDQVATYTVNFVLSAEEEILLQSKITKLATCTDGRLVASAEQLHRAIYGQPGPQNLVKTKSAFFSLLELIGEVANADQDSYYPIRAGVKALQTEWNQNRKVEEYAILCGISPAYFYRCFKNWCGQSPVEYRNSLRMRYAADLLSHTDMQIGEIAAMVGFEDPFYFSRIFTAQFGRSPRQYRRNRER